MGPNCEIDYVAVYNGDRITGENQMGQFCGHDELGHRPPVLTSSTNRMLVNFVTDGSDAFEGFSATYVQLDGKFI